MGASNEVLNLVLDELRHYGLKPTVEQLAKATHVRVAWTVPGKKAQRNVTVGRSSSTDVRTKMNARAQVRRLLRADGVKSPVLEREKKSLGQKAMQPGPQSEPAHIQLAQMRAEIADLTDLILDIALAVNAKARPAPPPPAAEAMNGHAAPADIEKLPKFKRTAADNLQPGSMQEKVFKAFPENGAPLKVEDIARVAGVPHHVLGGTFAALSGKGLAANPARGWWRRADRPLPEGWQAPTKAKPEKARRQFKHRSPDDLTPAQADVLARMPVGRAFATGELAKLMKASVELTSFHLRRIAAKGKVTKLRAGWYVRPDAFGRVPEGAAIPTMPSRVAATTPNTLVRRILDALPDGRAFQPSEMYHLHDGPPGGRFTTALRGLEQAGYVKQLQRGWWAKIVEGKPLPEVPPKPPRDRKPQPVTDPAELHVMEGGATDLVLKALPKGGLTSIAVLAERTGCKAANVNTALRWLRDKGIVVNPMRGAWGRLNPL